VTMCFCHCKTTLSWSFCTVSQMETSTPSNVSQRQLTKPSV